LLNIFSHTYISFVHYNTNRFEKRLGREGDELIKKKQNQTKRIGIFFFQKTTGEMLVSSNDEHAEQLIIEVSVAGTDTYCLIAHPKEVDTENSQVPASVSKYPIPLLLHIVHLFPSETEHVTQFGSGPEHKRGIVRKTMINKEQRHTVVAHSYA
jgi:hypothetical protein